MAGPLEQAIQGVDKNALLPPEVRGKPSAENFVDNAQDFAADVARQLDAAQTAKRSVVEITMSAAYCGAQDIPAIFDEAARIVRTVADALPHPASEVVQVVVQIASAGDEPSHLRRIVLLHE